MTTATPLIRLEGNTPPDQPLWVLACSIRGNAIDATHAMSLAMNCDQNSAAILIPYPESGKLSETWTEAAISIAKDHHGTYVIPWRRSFQRPALMLQTMQTGLETLFDLFWEKNRDDITVYLLTAPDQGSVVSTLKPGHLRCRPFGQSNADDITSKKGFA